MKNFSIVIWIFIMILSIIFLFILPIIIPSFSLNIFLVIIWIYNLSISLINLYKEIFEEKIIKNKLIKSDNFKLIEKNEKIGEYKLKQKINYLYFNEFEITFIKLYGNIMLTEIESIQKLKGIKAFFWNKNIFMALINNGDFEKTYFNKIENYIDNHILEDRKRKLLKLNNLN